MPKSCRLLTEHTMTELFFRIYASFQSSITKRVLFDAFNLFRGLWIYAAVGITATAALKSIASKERILGFFKKRKNSSILLAALLGVVSPLGTYVAIPLAAGLYRIGMPIAPLVAFVIASPLIDPNLFFLTAGALGYPMAVLRVVSALVLGLVGGYAASIVLDRGDRDPYDPKRQERPRTPDFRPGAAVFSAQTVPRGWFARVSLDLFRQTLFIGKYFLLALVIASVVKNCVSADWVMRYLGRSSFFSVLFAAGAGIPLYTCGGAAIPVLQELADLGMTKGAILAFFISGPATKVSTVVMLKSAFNTRTFLLYLSVVLAGAICFGYTVNVFM